MIDPTLANACGFAGMACIIGAYGYQTGSKRPNAFIQHGVNLLGAMLLTVSLLVFTNPASLVLEGFWASIAIFGLVRAWRNRRAPRDPAE
jgi:hypothetical protein